MRQIALVANAGAGVPEFLGVGLVSHIFERLGDLAVFDLVELLTAKLEVVALIDGEGAGPHDVDALFHILDHSVRGHFLRAGRERDVGHALKLHAAPTVGIAASV